MVVPHSSPKIRLNRPSFRGRAKVQPPGAQLDAVRPQTVRVGTVRKGPGKDRLIPHTADLRPGFLHMLQYVLHQPVAFVQCVEPAGHGNADLPQGELIKHLLKDLLNFGQAHLLYVQGKGGHAVALAEPLPQGQRFLRLRVAAVQDENKGLADLL